MSSFIFVRHGKSQANQDNVIGTPESPLTKEGQAQARRVGRELKGRGIQRILVSPYVRARQTAEIIAKQLKIADVEVIDDLRERRFGQLEDRPKVHPTAWYFTIDGESDVEPRGMLIARSEAALAKIKKIAETQKVLVVGHATSGFYLRQIAKGRRFFEDFDAPREIPNSGIVEVSIADKIPMQKTSREGVVTFVALAAGIACLVAAIWLYNQR